MSMTVSTIRISLLLEEIKYPKELQQYIELSQIGPFQDFQKDTIYLCTTRGYKTTRGQSLRFEKYCLMCVRLPTQAL